MSMITDATGAVPPTRMAPPNGRSLDVEQLSAELSSRRTGMSFQRTRMSADRTLMSIIRTSLSMIGFGFTIFSFFHQLQEGKILSAGSRSPGYFGLALVSLGILMLALGIVYHVRYMADLRRLRGELVQQGLVHGQSPYPVSMTLITAIVLLLIGLLAVVSMALDTRAALRAGPTPTDSNAALR